MKRKIIALLLFLCLLPGTALAAAVDMEESQAPTAPQTEWYSQGVEFCARRGVVRWEEGGAFDPEAPLSNIAFIAMLSRAYGLYDEGERAGSDALAGHFAAAVEHGLVRAEEFPPDSWPEPINRFQAADLCYQALLRFGGYGEEDNFVYLDNAADRADIPRRYRPAVNGVYGAGVMSGTDGALTFSGLAAVSGGQGCVLLHRLLEEQARQAPVLTQYGMLFGAYTTSYAPPAEGEVSLHRENSIFNLRRAGAALDGAVIAPGAAFSFNRTVGNPGRDNGYLLGEVVSGGKKTLGYGGGVCQTSTTLFDAALLANMTITQRHNHGLKSAYVPAGVDSAIYYPTWDLEFVNPYPCPVKIIFEDDPAAQTITVRIYGAVGTYTPAVTWAVEERGGVYTLTRYADGAENYTCTSKYRN